MTNQPVVENGLFVAKCPRDRLSLLCTEALPCPDVVRRLLALVSGEAALPVDLIVDHGAMSQWIGIFFDRDIFTPSSRLIGRIENIPSVIFAGWLEDLTSSLSMPDANLAHGFVTFRALIEISRRRWRQQIIDVPERS